MVTYEPAETFTDLYVHIFERVFCYRFFDSASDYAFKKSHISLLFDERTERMISFGPSSVLNTETVSAISARELSRIIFF